jgi:hypothetical protein
MAERDRFELALAAALRAYAEDAPTQARPTELARHFATAYPRRRAAIGPWRLPTALRPAWVLLLLATLLAALVGGALLVGSQPERRVPAVVPPIGQLFECPPGSTPDEPGPVGQARPTAASLERIVFDRRAGRLVTLTSTADGLAPETWTFDVCTNTWIQMHPDRELPDFVGQLIYDVDSDVTIAVTSGKAWAYDLRANTWTEKGVTPPGADLGAYDPVSGLVVAVSSSDDPVGSWTYDVETDTWTQIHRVNGEPCGGLLMGYDASVDRMVGYRGTGWGNDTTMLCLIDMRTGTWSGTRAGTPPDFNTGFYATVPSIVYDEATEHMVFSDGRRLAAYDATADRWEILVEADPGGVPLLIAYDPLHRRLVGVGWGEDRPDVAFDPTTREWTVLVDRDPAVAPWPRPTPAPTVRPTPAPTVRPTPSSTE